MRTKLVNFLGEFFYQIMFAIFIIPALALSYCSAQKEKLMENTQDSGPPFALCDSSCDVITQVIVDGKPLRFKVDTGAQITIIYEGSLGLIPPYMGSCHIGGAYGGTSERCYLSTLSEIEVAGMKAKNVGVAITPPHNSDYSEKVDGILGIDFLRNYKVILSKNNLQLYEAEDK